MEPRAGAGNGVTESATEGPRVLCPRPFLFQIAQRTDAITDP